MTTEASTQVDILLTRDDQRRMGKFVNWRGFGRGCGDRVCVRLSAVDHDHPIYWETPSGHRVEIGSDGEHWHASAQYGVEPPDGTIISLNVVTEQEALWHAANLDATPQSLFRRGFVPLCRVAHRDGEFEPKWMVYRIEYGGMAP